ncbi:MAG: hypothetical protein JWO38_849 [Gemmataceae bacterium]|nr:hypothetical protein [Gemmataceae bacterium]
MRLGKTLVTSASVVLAAGLVWGFAWVGAQERGDAPTALGTAGTAAQPEKPAASTPQPSAPPNKNPTAQPPPPEADPLTQLRLRQLEEAADQLTKEIRQREEMLLDLREKLMQDLPDLRAKLHIADELFAIDKDILKSNIQRLAVRIGDVEDNLFDQKRKGGEGTEIRKEELVKEALTRELTKVKSEYEQFVRKHYAETARLHQPIEKFGSEHPRLVAINHELTRLRETLAKIKDEAIQLKLALPGPPSGSTTAPALTGTDAKLNQVL